MKKMMNVALVITLVGSIIAGAKICDTNNITDQDIAEFAAVYNHGDECEEMTVEIIKTNDYEEGYDGSTIDCVVYEDGVVKYYHTINKDYYRHLMETNREDS